MIKYMTAIIAASGTLSGIVLMSYAALAKAMEIGPLFGMFSIGLWIYGLTMIIFYESGSVTYIEMDDSDSRSKK